MKYKFLFLFFLIILSGKSHSQNKECSFHYIDSLKIRYWAIEGNNIIDITLKSDRYTLSINEDVSKVNYAPETIQIYKTHSTDTIDYLFTLTNLVLIYPPIIDPDIEIIDCCDEMSISIFEKEYVCEFSYHHYRFAYFPFAYTELYSFIRQILYRCLR